MTRLRAVMASTVALLTAVAACDRQGPNQVLEPVTEETRFSHGSTCHATGTGLTAKVVNEDVIGQTIEIDDCDVGAFFDEDGVVKNASFVQTDATPAPNVQHLVRVEDARVEVTGSDFHVTPDYAHQIIHIGYRDGATGVIAGNTLTGFKRAGILLDGAGTAATIERNEVTGVGEKTTGWAENGIQISRGATGTVTDNRISDHWWDKNDFLSSGLLVFAADEVTAQRNTLEGNDGSLLLIGDRNNAVQNVVRATAPDGSRDGTQHFGAVVSGENNGVRQTDFTTATGADAGVFVFSGSANTKLIRNSFSDGFGVPIVDNGDGTKLPRPFVP